MDIGDRSINFWDELAVPRDKVVCASAMKKTMGRAHGLFEVQQVKVA